MTKKFFASLLLTLSLGLFFAPASLAQTTGATPVSSYIEQVRAWLYTNNKGIDAINNDLNTQLNAAQQKTSDSHLQEFNLNFPTRDNLKYTYSFADGKTPNGIFDVPLRLRDLVPAMQSDKSLLPSLNRLFGAKAHIKGAFRLVKNASGLLVWEVTLTDTVTNHSYLVRTPATANKAAFMILNK